MKISTDLCSNNTHEPMGMICAGQATSGCMQKALSNALLKLIGNAGHYTGATHIYGIWIKVVYRWWTGYTVLVTGDLYRDLSTSEGRFEQLKELSRNSDFETNLKRIMF